MFVLSGAEDLVPVADDAARPGAATGRGRRGCSPGSSTSPTTTGDYWEVRSRDGLITRYGTPRPADADPGRTRPPSPDPRRTRRGSSRWRITETTDLLGNLVRYEYLARLAATSRAPHRWDQPLLQPDLLRRLRRPGRSVVPGHGGVRVRGSGRTRSPTTGPGSRSARRCGAARSGSTTHAADGVARVAREYRLQLRSRRRSTARQPADPGRRRRHRRPVGSRRRREQALPPLTFGYSGVRPGPAPVRAGHRRRACRPGR